MNILIALLCLLVSLVVLGAYSELFSVKEMNKKRFEKTELIRCYVGVVLISVFLGIKVVIGNVP